VKSPDKKSNNAEDPAKNIDSSISGDAADSNSAGKDSGKSSDSCGKSKRKSVGVSQIKLSSISKKVPMFMAKSSKGSITYFSLILEAIVEINDRTGSSIPAISKWMKAKHTELQEVKPKGFSVSVNAAIKVGMKEGKLLKVRCSYKVNKEWMNRTKVEQRAKEAKKKAAERKKKKDEAETKKKKKDAAIKSEKEKKQKELEQLKKKQQDEANAAKAAKAALTDAEIAALKETKKKKEEALKKKEDAAKRAKELEDILKKRRFPIDDLVLIAEDKKLGVKKPADVGRSPFLPFALHSLLPHDARPKNKKTTAQSVVTACSTESETGSSGSGSRGLVSDLIQVYHFFRGDFNYSRLFDKALPEFSLKHLFHASNEIVLGNAKRSRVVPPLISYLFVLALNVLTTPTSQDWVSSDSSDEDRTRFNSLKADCTNLNHGLTDCSWGETLLCFIHAMETFFTTNSSTDQNALPGHSIPMDDDNSNQYDVESFANDDDILPLGYFGYLGPADGSMRKAYHKLTRQDPWNLTAEELISLLRSLCDDILVMKTDLAKEVAERDEKLWELLKAKKSAESNFRKIRLAYEGPKQKSRAKSKLPAENNVPNGEKDNNFVEKKFVPTVSKAEFEEATKAREKAVANYDKGVKFLVHRSRPVGVDKHRNPVFFFHHAPESLYIEVSKGENGFKQTKTWHCIDNKTLFDTYISSLDVRGIREGNLYEQLAGESSSSAYRRNLYSSNQKDTLTTARKREIEDLQRRLDNAMIANAESSRRSGRLASSSKDEVSKIQEEIVESKVRFEEQLAAFEVVDDYTLLTGTKLVADFEESMRLVPRCSQLWNVNKGNPGIIGRIAESILDLEKFCNILSPWDRGDTTQLEWRENIEQIVIAWRNGSEFHIGPKSKVCGDDGSITPNKKQRLSLDGRSKQTSSASVTFDYALSTLKGPLVELEARVYTILGIERAVLEVDEANDNLSVETDSSDNGDEKEAEKLERANYAWKRKIWSLSSIPARRAAAIRDVLISAIAIARKGHLSDALEDLRAALQIHRPGGGGRARSAALGLLDKYGFKMKEDDDSESIEGDDGSLEIESSDDLYKKDLKQTSFLSAEAMMLNGSLEGDDNADRVDWRDAVTSCKSVSRFAALTAALISRAIPRLDKLAKDNKTLRKAIQFWETNGKTRKGKSKKNLPKFSSATEIWADVKATDQFVTSKVEGFPWWPARICVPKDSDISTPLENVGRVIVSFVGEQHLYTVDKTIELKPLVLDIDESDLSQYETEVVKNLKNSLSIARRILRGRGMHSNVTGIEHLEEKKTSS